MDRNIFLRFEFTIKVQINYVFKGAHIVEFVINFDFKNCQIIIYKKQFGNKSFIKRTEFCVSFVYKSMPVFRTSSLSCRLVNEPLQHTVHIVILFNSVLSQQMNRIQTSFRNYCLYDNTPY